MFGTGGALGRDEAPRKGAAAGAGYKVPEGWGKRSGAEPGHVLEFKARECSRKGAN